MQNLILHTAIADSFPSNAEEYFEMPNCHKYLKKKAVLTI